MDAAFILQLMNQPAWLRNIGDRNIHSLGAARRYLRDHFMPAYGGGLGFWVVAERESADPVGICGLARRGWMEREDLGFAILEAYRGRGYAAESAAAVMDYAREVLGLGALQAFALPDNRVSIRLLHRLGFSPMDERVTPDDQRVRVFGRPLG